MFVIFVERSDARHGAVIRFVVLQKYRKGYPRRLVGNTGGILSSLQECQSED